MTEAGALGHVGETEWTVARLEQAQTTPDLRVALVGHGRRPIPPTGWGAVENIIWQYARRLRDRGRSVYVVNRKWRFAPMFVTSLWMANRIDVCHVHNDKANLLFGPLGRRLGMPVVSTSHYFFNPERMDQEAEECLDWVCRADMHLVLNEAIAELVRARKPYDWIRVLPNGTEVRQFRTYSKGNGRAICVGKLQARKRQRLTAKLLREAGIECDFVGPVGDEDLEPEDRARHLGEWSREELRERLGQYGALILFSEAEGQPLVVAEALAAGIPVVVSPQAAQNLDTTLPFIHVVDEPERLASATRCAIGSADTQRAAARRYAERQFDFDSLVLKYEGLLLEALAYWNQARLGA